MIKRSLFLLCATSCISAHAEQVASTIVLPDLGEPEAPFTTQKTTTPEPIAPVVPFSSLPSSSPALLGIPGAGLINTGGSPFAQTIRLGDANAGASIGASASDFRFEGKDYLAHIGVQYASPNSTYGYGIKADGAASVSSTFALGANLSAYSNIKEAVFNSVWMPEDTHVKMKLSTAYMWGQQSFDFYSGVANASLTQASYYFSGQYVVPKETSNYLHTIGISNWGTKANQTNTADPVYVVAQNATAYQIMMDPRKLSTGTLQGASLDTQVGLIKQIVIKASLGYESLTFPYSDGTSDINKTVYQNYVAQYQPISEVLLQAGYKMGAAMNNLTVSAGYEQFLLTGFKNNGNNGMLSSHGMMLTYRISLDGKATTPLNLLARPESIGSSSYVLRDSFVRPIQLPQAFLAKVDTTAVKTVATINKAGLASGAIVNAAGDVLVTVGAGGGVITGVTRNGAAYAFASTVAMSGTQVVIRVKLLPIPGGGTDTYIASVTDSTAAPHLATFTTQP